MLLFGGSLHFQSSVSRFTSLCSWLEETASGRDREHLLPCQPVQELCGSWPVEFFKALRIFSYKRLFRFLKIQSLLVSKYKRTTELS